jgi:hypothetical protein
MKDKVSLLYKSGTNEQQVFNGQNYYSVSSSCLFNGLYGSQDQKYSSAFNFNYINGTKYSYDDYGDKVIEFFSPNVLWGDSYQNRVRAWWGSPYGYEANGNNFRFYQVQNFDIQVGGNLYTSINFAGLQMSTPGHLSFGFKINLENSNNTKILIRLSQSWANPAYALIDLTGTISVTYSDDNYINTIKTVEAFPILGPELVYEVRVGCSVGNGGSFSTYDPVVITFLPQTHVDGTPITINTVINQGLTTQYNFGDEIILYDMYLYDAKNRFEFSLNDEDYVNTGWKTSMTDDGCSESYFDEIPYDSFSNPNISVGLFDGSKTRGGGFSDTVTFWAEDSVDLDEVFRKSPIRYNQSTIVNFGGSSFPVNSFNYDQIIPGNNGLCRAFNLLDGSQYNNITCSFFVKALGSSSRYIGISPYLSTTNNNVLSEGDPSLFLPDSTDLYGFTTIDLYNGTIVGYGGASVYNEDVYVSYIDNGWYKITYRAVLSLEYQEENEYNWAYAGALLSPVHSNGLPIMYPFLQSNYPISPEDQTTLDAYSLLIMKPNANASYYDFDLFKNDLYYTSRKQFSVYQSDIVNIQKSYNEELNVGEFKIGSIFGKFNINNCGIFSFGYITSNIVNFGLGPFYFNSISASPLIIKNSDETFDVYIWVFGESNEYSQSPFLLRNRFKVAESLNIESGLIKYYFYYEPGIGYKLILNQNTFILDENQIVDYIDFTFSQSKSYRGKSISFGIGSGQFTTDEINGNYLKNDVGAIVYFDQFQTPPKFRIDTFIGFDSKLNDSEILLLENL